MPVKAMTSISDEQNKLLTARITSFHNGCVDLTQNRSTQASDKTGIVYELSYVFHSISSSSEGHAQCFLKQKTRFGESVAQSLLLSHNSEF